MTAAQLRSFEQPAVTLSAASGPRRHRGRRLFSSVSECEEHLPSTGVIIIHRVGKVNPRGDTKRNNVTREDVVTTAQTVVIFQSGPRRGRPSVITEVEKRKKKALKK